MKKTAIAAAFLAVSVMLAACATKPTTPNTSVRSELVSEETTTEETTTVAAAKEVPANPNLFGNPDEASMTERGVMKSADVEAAWVSEMYSYTSVIEWIDYSPIVAGSEYTVEFLINDETTTGEKIKLYIFEKNDEYAWDTSLAVATFDGDACNTVIGHEYWCKTILPTEIATGDYTLVVVRGDGTVDSMVDIQIVNSVDETTSSNSID
ncbi:MAG: hypothetical protein J6U23_14130 [Clostridiales bacterium]|nr:hypothetical protein [Clostridiales bacterium]